MNPSAATMMACSQEAEVEDRLLSREAMTRWMVTVLHRVRLVQVESEGLVELGPSLEGQI
jgi:hypothetical protein